MREARLRRRRRRVWRPFLGLLALAVAFVAGIGLGEALSDGGPGEGTQTVVRTLRPGTLSPLPVETVTITTSRP